MKRIYLSPILQLGGEVGNVPAVLMDGEQRRGITPGTSTGILMAVGPDGLPLYSWCMVFADFSDPASAADAPGVYQFPEHGYDSKVSGMTSEAKSVLLTALGQRGIPTGSINNNDAFREVVRMVGRIQEPSFDERFGVYAL